MLRGDWRGYSAAVLIAAIFALFGLALLHSHEAEQDRERPRADTSARYEIGGQYLTPRAGLPAVSEKFAANPEPKSTKEREERDLAAQEAAAVWSFWMLVVSTIGVLTTMVGTGFLLWQISLTREAVEDTGKATLAMEEANKIAKETQAANLAVGQSQVRAYISLSNIDVCDHDHGFEVEFDVENSGQSPARRVNITFQVSLQATPFSVAPRTMPLGDFSASHRETGKTFAFKLPEEWDGFVSETSVFDIALVATFFDVFEQRREEPTHFCVIKGTGGYAFLRTPF